MIPIDVEGCRWTDLCERRQSWVTAVRNILMECKIVVAKIAANIAEIKNFFDIV
jgi:hypothetical protein